MPTKPTHEPDRVRRHTTPRTRWRIDDGTRANIRHYGTQPGAELDARIAALERKWDMERILETNASILALTGAVLGLTRNPKWFFLTGGVLGFLAQHALMGWCPPVPVFRQLGVRTQNEIDRERYALKAVRGDFAGATEMAPSMDLPGAPTEP